MIDFRERGGGQIWRRSLNSSCSFVFYHSAKFWSATLIYNSNEYSTLCRASISNFNLTKKSQATTSKLINLQEFFPSKNFKLKSYCTHSYLTDYLIIHKWVRWTFTQVVDWHSSYQLVTPSKKIFVNKYEGRLP